MIGPTPKQKEAHQILRNNDIVLYGGAVRGAKTWWLFLELFTYCYQFPNSRWLFLRESETTIKRNTFPSFNQFLSTGAGQHISNWNMATLTVTWDNDSQIIFMPESYHQDKELNRFRGLEINGAAIDEINELQEVTFNKVIERAGSWTHAKGMPPVKILATCNPSHNWVRTRFYDPFLKNQLPKGWAYIQSKITDNPYTPASYLENLKNNLPDLLYQRFVDGDWDAIDVKKPFAYAFKPHVHISDQAILNPNLYIYLSFDFNVDPATCAVFQDGGNYIYQIGEFHLKSSSIYDLCDAIKAKYGGILVVTGDASGWAREKAAAGLENLYDIIRRELNIPHAAVKTPRSNGLIRDSRVLLNAVMERHTFRIHPSCENTIKSLSFCETDEYGDIPKTSEHLKHHLDTVRYYFNTFHSNFVMFNEHIYQSRRS